MYAQNGDRRIFFDIDGSHLGWDGDVSTERPVIVVISGGPGFSHLHLRPWLAPLAQRFSLVYVELGGAGDSTRTPGGSYPLEEFVEDLEAVRRAIGVERIVPLGHSFGGPVALEYALAHPEHTAAVMAANSIHSLRYMREGGMDVMEPDESDPLFATIAAFRGKLAAAAASGDWSEADVDRSWTLLNRGTFVSGVPPLWDRLDTLAVVNAECHYRNASASMFGLEHGPMDEWDILPRLPQVTAPALFIGSAEDNGTPFYHSEEMHAALPGSELAVISPSGHFSFVEQPEQFRAAVTGFMERSGLPGADTDQALLDRSTR